MKNRFIEGASLLVFGLAMISLLIPLGINGQSDYHLIAMSPVFWPKLISWLIILLGALLVTSGILTRDEAREEKCSKIKNRSFTLILGNNTKGTISLAFLPIYYIALLNWGLVIPSILAFTFYASLHTTKKALSSFFWGVFIVLCVTVFFTIGANVLIPLGPLELLGL